MNRRQQIGSFLIESLIGALVISILALGLIQTAIQVEHSRADAKAKGLAILQMRELLQKNGADLCGSTTNIDMPNSISIELTPSCKTQVVTVQNTQINLLQKEITLSSKSSENTKYFGGILEVGEFISNDSL